MNGTDVLNLVVTSVFTVQIALGLTIIFGVMRVINMAHGDFFMLGAFTMVTVSNSGLPVWVGIVLAPIVVGALGAAVERGIVRRLYGRRDLSTLLATFALSIAFEQLVDLIWGPQSFTVRAPINGTVTVIGATYPTYRLVAAGVAVLVIAAVALLIYRTAFGIRIRATMQDGETAAALGTNTHAITSSAFGLGTALAGLAGALMAPFVGVNYAMGLAQTVQSFLVVITGGMGSIGGTVGGGILIGGGQSALSVPLSGTVAEILVLLLAIFVMLLRPGGIFSRGQARTA